MKKNNGEFYSIIKDIVDNNKFNKLNKELHHGITRYDHSMRVAKWTYNVCHLFNKENISEVTRAALLHDFYIDKDLKSKRKYQKLGEHPNIALENSSKYFELNELQEDIIKSHMFPCTLVIPKYKESWMVSLIDKAVSTYEMIRFKLSLYTGIYLLFLFEIIRIQK